MYAIRSYYVAKEEEGSGSRSLIEDLPKHCINMMKILKHRGPDYSGMMFDDDVFYFDNFDDIDLSFEYNSRLGISHNRLAIVGTAVQPRITSYNVCYTKLLRTVFICR